MKLVILIFALTIYLSPVFGQLKSQDTSLTEYIKIFNYIKTSIEADTNSIKKHPSNVNFTLRDKKILAISDYISNLPLDEFLNIIQKRVYAYEEDLFKPQEFWLKHDDNLVNKNAVDSISFGLYEGILQNHLIEAYGDMAADLILSPVLLKIKVSTVQRKPYMIDNKLGVNQKIVTGKILDIVKGKNHFKIGGELEFYLMDFWIQTDKHFSEGSEYFVYLIPVIDNFTGEHRLALNVNKINSGFVWINNNVLWDEENYYGYGIVEWETFKKNIEPFTNPEKIKEN